MLKFLRWPLMAALLMAATISPSLAGQRISSKALGFEISLPDDWVILSQDQILADNARASSLKDEAAALLKDRVPKLPLIVAARFDEPYPDFNPNIQIRMVAYAAGQPRDIRVIADSQLQHNARLARNAAPVAPAELTELDGLQVAHAKLQATLKTQSGELPFISEAWFIPKAEFYLIVSIAYRPDGRTGTRDAAAAAVQSMKIVRDEL